MDDSISLSLSLFSSLSLLILLSLLSLPGLLTLLTLFSFPCSACLLCLACLVRLSSFACFAPRETPRNHKETQRNTEEHAEARSHFVSSPSQTEADAGDSSRRCPGAAMCAASSTMAMGSARGANAALESDMGYLGGTVSCCLFGSARRILQSGCARGSAASSPAS